MIPGALLPLVLGAAIGPHPDSLSHSRVVVRGSEAELVLRFQTLSLLEVERGLDADQDGALTRAELDAGRGALEAYLASHYRLLVDGAALPAFLVSAGPTDAPEDTAGGYAWTEARLAVHGPRALDVFDIECRLFLEANPFHRDFATVVAEGDEPVQHVFSAEASTWRFERANVRRPGVLGLFVRLGFEHILGGHDHLAFLLALLLAVARWRGLLAVVTAFTVAHSITLAAVALDPGGWLDRIPDRFVELAIALSIAYVASGNLFLKQAHTPWLEAFGFGLLHGLGFASFLGAALAGEPLVVTALFGFNLGVEAGQLLVVGALSLVFLPLAWLERRRARATHGAPAPGLAPRWLRLTASAAVTLLALYWFAERAGWVG